MKKIIFTTEYVMGHLRTGHFEADITNLSEERMKKLKEVLDNEEYFDALDIADAEFILDDHELDDYQINGYQIIDE